MLVWLNEISDWLLHFSTKKIWFQSVYCTLRGPCAHMLRVHWSGRFFACASSRALSIIFLGVLVGCVCTVRTSIHIVPWPKFAGGRRLARRWSKRAGCRSRTCRCWRATSSGSCSPLRRSPGSRTRTYAASASACVRALRGDWTTSSHLRATCMHVCVCARRRRRPNSCCRSRASGCAKTPRVRSTSSQSATISQAAPGVQLPGSPGCPVSCLLPTPTPLGS